MTKPVITKDQMIQSSVAAKQFGRLRKKAKQLPQFVTENGVIDTVVLDYNYYEKMYERLMELEGQEDAEILEQRIERFEKNPELSASWRDVRRTVK